MFRPAIQKTRFLVVLAVFNLSMFYIASNSTIVKETRGYDAKVRASRLMKKSMDTLKEARMGQNVVFVDSENDPNETALVGPQFSLITTDEGNLDHKLTTLNPNFAALMVELLMEADVQTGDRVAVSLTGSMPGANIAALAACDVMGLKPVIITSVGASQWGATDPYFTWLDMEKILVDSSLISFSTVAASIGGKGDTGKGMSLRGRELLWETIYRNGAFLIQEENLLSSIDKRMELYKQSAPGEAYSVFINVGGGAASIGPSVNARLLPSGVSVPQELNGLGSKSVIREFAKLDVPVIQILDIWELARDYDLPYAPIPMPEVGTGSLYSLLLYNRWINILTLIMAIGSVVAVGIYSHKEIKKQTDSYEPESIL